MNNIRNFCIIAHIDHGKSTLADRLLEMTGTIEKRKMKEQVLDTMDLERERGITIKLQPATMIYRLSQTNADLIQTNADNKKSRFLFEDITYKIRGAAFKVKKELGLGHKEIIYHKALEKEFQRQGLNYKSEPSVVVNYQGEFVGRYQPDFLIEGKVIVELKALPKIAKPQQEQLWSYLKGNKYKLAMLINFGSTDVEFKRVVYDTARSQRESAFSQQKSAQIENYILNLIDTPGHVDFGYEVSRSLAAVEGAILLVDATQGVQAQTLANLYQAVEQGLEIIPVINKIDLPNADVEKTRQEILGILGPTGKENPLSPPLKKGETGGFYDVGIILASGKTGEGVDKILEAIIRRIPAPESPLLEEYKNYNNQDTITKQISNSKQIKNHKLQNSNEYSKDNLGINSHLRGDDRGDNLRNLDIENSFKIENLKFKIPLRALIFDSKYDSYKGVLAYVRIVDGEVKAEDDIYFMAGGQEAHVIEVGKFSPQLVKKAKLTAGDIGYIATGLKSVEQCKVGDTITKSSKIKAQMSNKNLKIQNSKFKSNPLLQAINHELRANLQPLPGYKEVKPMVYASFYPREGEDYNQFRDALEKLKLNDAALNFEGESSPALGRGFRMGFLGLLHLEIIKERLKREFGFEPTITTPSVVYKIIKTDNSVQEIFAAAEMPEQTLIKEIQEPHVKLDIVTPSQYLGNIMELIQKNTRSRYLSTEYINNQRLIVSFDAPLNEVIINLHDGIQSASSGFASFSYDFSGYLSADLVRLDIYVAEERVSALSQVMPREKVEKEGRRIVGKLKNVIPRQNFLIKIQAAVGGKFLARENIQPFRKDVTGHLYGGDITRKRKLLEKQRKGKKKMKAGGRAQIPQEAFLEILRR